MFAKWISTDNRFNFSETDNGGIIITNAEHDTAMSLINSGISVEPDANGKPIQVTNPAIQTQIISVSMRQARLALIRAGQFKSVNDAIMSLTGIAGDEARVWWEFSPTVDRSDTLVAQITTALNITSAQLDALFTSAATL